MGPLYGTTTWITTTYSYNNLGQLVQTTYPLTNGVMANTTEAYDALGRITTVTDELSHKMVTQYNALGRPVTVTVNYVDGVFNSNNPDEDLITITSYDVAGNRVAVNDPRNVVSQYSYDQQQRLIGVVENYVQGGPTTPMTNVQTLYGYNAAGDLTSIQDARQYTSTLQYDLLDRQVSAADPMGHTTVYTYNVAGDRIAMLDAKGQVTNYTNDLLDRQTAVNYPVGTASVNFAYDALSQRTVMTDGTGTSGWTYDAAGRPVTIAEPTVGSVGYGYDSDGNRTSLTYPGSKVVNYAYNLAGRMGNVTDWNGKQTTYSDNALGQVTTAVLPNGVTSRYSYDQAERLKTISHATALQMLGAYTYTVDAIGNRSQVQETQVITASSGTTASHSSVASGAIAANMTRNSVTALTGGSAMLTFTRIKPGAPAASGTQTIAYSYDNLYRLTRAAYSDGSYFAYDYDADGNIVSKTACLGGAGCTPQVTSYAYDNANRLSSVGGVGYAWDNNGNLLNDGAFSYGYDAANRLISVTNGVTTTLFTYNGLGNRVAENDGGVVTTYTLDLAAGLTQVLADGTNIYLYGNGRIAQYTGASAQYFLADALGSVRQLADGTGAVDLAQSYEPYGSVLTSIGTGLIDLRTRQYDPTLGRFVQRDSWPGNKRRPMSLNHWFYTNGNPLKYTDPTGHCIDGFTTIICIALAGAAVGALVSYGSQVASNVQSGMDLGTAMTTNIDGAKIATGAGIGAVGGLIGGVAIPALAAFAGSAAAATAVGIGATTADAAIVGGVTTVGASGLLAGATNAGLGTTQRMIDDRRAGNAITPQAVANDLGQHGAFEFGVGAISGGLGQIASNLIDINFPAPAQPYGAPMLGSLKYPVSSVVQSIVPDARAAYVRAGAQLAAQAASDPGLFALLGGLFSGSQTQQSP
jgi:RHS repeat-associated protein